MASEVLMNTRMITNDIDTVIAWLEEQGYPAACRSIGYTYVGANNAWRISFLNGYDIHMIRIWNVWVDDPKLGMLFALRWGA